MFIGFHPTTRVNLTTMKFKLEGIDFYALRDAHKFVKAPIPAGSTTIDNILLPRHLGRYVDVDIHRQKHTCLLINHSDLVAQALHARKGLQCWYCRSTIDATPVGLPISFQESVRVHDDTSHILKKQFLTLRDAHTDPSSEGSVQSREWFETEGYYCSLNCIAAQLLEPSYATSIKFQSSISLLCSMATMLLNTPITSVEPAADWKLLKHNGGSLSIEEWRASIGSTQYISHPTTIMHPTSYIYTVEKKF